MGLHSAAKSAYVDLRAVASDNRLLEYKWFLEQEVDTWDHWLPLPVGRRLRLWRNGFTSPCGVLYDFDAHDQTDYLSDLQRYRFYRRINDRYRYHIDDKLTQHWMMADHPDHRPTALGYVDGGAVHGIAGTEYDGDPTPVSAWMPETLRRESRLVVKQLRGLGGKQVHICAFDDGFSLDGEPVSEEALCAELSTLSGYLVTAFVDQHDYADALYPHATNTIRILTLWDDRNEEVLVPMAAHRIGTERSRPVDNWSVGGVSAPIDLETGELGQAAQFPFSQEVPRYSRHPDTGARIEGASVPAWERIHTTVEAFARENTHLPAIGWDVVLNDDEAPIVIEANTGTEIDLFQVHEPLLADPAVSRLVGRYLPGVEPAD